MGRVSTCQINCKTIDLRGAQVNRNHCVIKSELEAVIADTYDLENDNEIICW